MATVIYNDRINTWRKMKKLDELLDKKPKANDVAAMAELRIRNLQAFEELKAYNDTGKFLYKHPLLKGKSEFDELVKLFKKDLPSFFTSTRTFSTISSAIRATLKEMIARTNVPATVRISSGIRNVNACSRW